MQHRHLWISFLGSLSFALSGYGQFVGFRSDNVAGACPEVIAAVLAENARDYALPYGNDDTSKKLKARAKEVFGDDTESFVVQNGTAANVLAISGVKSVYQSVIGARTSHLVVDEANAPTLRGIRVYTVDDRDGKISPAALGGFDFRTDVHAAPVKVITITQPTEYGVVYSPDEIHALAAFAHKRGLLLHMDGARLSNAAASLGVALKQTSFAVGVDVLSFGGTKNGLLGGELVVFRDATLAGAFAFQKKSELQLGSKERFTAAQLLGLLSEGVWEKNARTANAMALQLRDGIQKMNKTNLIVSRPTQANAVFAKLPTDACLRKLEQLYSFEVWDTGQREIRLMTSFKTSEAEVDRFLEHLRQFCSGI